MRFGERSGTFVAKDGASPPHQQNCSRATITSAGTEPPGAAELDSRLAPLPISWLTQQAGRPAQKCGLPPSNLQPLALLLACLQNHQRWPAARTYVQTHHMQKPQLPNHIAISSGARRRVAELLFHSPHAPFSRFSINITYQMDPQ